MSSVYLDKSLTFAQMGLDARVWKAIARLGHVYPTHVQRACITAGMQGRDIVARSATGSGKTLAFLVPSIERVLQLKGIGGTAGGGVRVVVLVHSLELCAQVYAQCREMMQFCSDVVSAVGLSGGISIKQQCRLLRRGPDIVISTPTRLLWHLKKGTVSLAKLAVVIVDEADLMFTLGTDTHIRTIYDQYIRGGGSDKGKRAPKQRLPQCMLVSATLSKDLHLLKSCMVHSANPLVYQPAATGPGSVQDGATSKDLVLHRVVRCIDQLDKFLHCYAMLKLGIVPTGKCLFFVNSNTHAYMLKLFLDQFSIPAAVLNSNLPALSRANIIQQFNRGVFDFLIATECPDGSVLPAKKQGVSKQDTTEQAQSDGADGASDSESDSSGSSSSSSDDDDDNSSSSRSAAEKKSSGKESKTQDEPEADSAKDPGQQSSASQLARGIDFVDVAAVCLLDFPESKSAYLHRAGRTGRAGKGGVVFSFVVPKEEHLLKKVAHVPRDDDDSDDEEVVPSDVDVQKLNYERKDVLAFKYRVEDIFRKVSRKKARQAELRDIHREILRSKKLRKHFEDHPLERQLILEAQENALMQTSLGGGSGRANQSMRKVLSEVPEYLLPDSVARGARKAGKRTKRGTNRKRGRGNAEIGSRQGGKKRYVDPLVTMSGGDGRRGLYGRYDPKPAAGAEAKSSQWSL